MTAAPRIKQHKRQPEKVAFSFTDPTPKAAQILTLAGLVLAGIIVYANSFSGQFVLDDFKMIVYNPQFRSLWPPWHLFQGTNRPLINLSFAFKLAFGQNKPLGLSCFQPDDPYPFGLDPFRYYPSHIAESATG